MLGKRRRPWANATDGSQEQRRRQATTFNSSSHLVIRTVNLAEAKAGLSPLLNAVEAAEEVVITRRGRPVARVIQETPGGRIYLDACEQTMACTWPWPIATTSSAANP